LESTGDTSFNVKVSADQVQGTMQGAAIAFQDADGKALIAIEYGGDEKEFVGVLVRSPELTGTFASDALEDPFFPQLSGFAWTYGTLAEVNGSLASLRFIPAAGFSAPDGVGIGVHAYLYGFLGVSTQSSSGGISVIVPKRAAAPIAQWDFFEFDRPSEPIRLNVLANDSSPSDSTLRLVGISQSNYPDVNELSVTTQFGTVLEIDPETNEIILTPSWASYESFAYVVSDAEGRLSQGKFAVSLRPIPE